MVLRHLAEIASFDETHEGIFFSLTADFDDELLNDMSSFCVLTYSLEVPYFRKDAHSISGVNKANRIYQRLYEVVCVVVSEEAIHRFSLADALENHFLQLLGLVRARDLSTLLDLLLEKFAPL